MLLGRHVANPKIAGICNWLFLCRPFRACHCLRFSPGVTPRAIPLRPVGAFCCAICHTGAGSVVSTGIFWEYWEYWEYWLIVPEQWLGKRLFSTPSIPRKSQYSQKLPAVPVLPQIQSAELSPGVSTGWSRRMSGEAGFRRQSNAVSTSFAGGTASVEMLGTW